MEFHYNTYCPACNALLSVFLDKELTRKMLFNIDHCPVCTRPITLLMGSKDGILRNIEDSTSPNIIEVRPAKVMEPEKPLNPDKSIKDPLNKSGVIGPRNIGTAPIQVPPKKNDEIAPLPVTDQKMESEKKEHPYGVVPILVAPTPPHQLPYVKWAIRGMIFGIIATVSGALAWFPAVGFVYSALGIIFGMIAFIKGKGMKKEFQQNPGRFRPSSLKMINISFSLGLLGFILSIVMIFVCFATTLAVYD